MDILSIFSKGKNMDSNGFEIQSPSKHWVSWHIAQRDFYRKYKSLLDFTEETSVRLLYPVRIGSLVFQDFSIPYFSKDSHKPIYCFCAKLQERNSKETLVDWARVFEKQGGNIENVYYAEKNRDFVIRPINPSKPLTSNLAYGEDILHLDGVVLYWGSVEVVLSTEIEKGEKQVVVNFLNLQSIDAFFNKEYAEHLQLTKHLALQDKRLSVINNVQFNKEIYLKKITDERMDEVWIWRDEVNACIGFIDKNYMQLYSWEEIAFFNITAVDDGRRGFYSQLEVHFRGYKKSEQVLFYSGSPEKVHFFDDKIDRLKTLFQKEVYWNK